MGRGPGLGYSANVPVQPFTQDASWLEVVRTVLPECVEWFKPDLLVSVHGADTHLWDPLTHLALSVNAMQAQTELTHQLAHAYTGGRWLALGAGGYDPYRVNARAWGMLWAEMSGRSTGDTLPEGWRERWQNGCEFPLPTTWLDPAAEHPPMPRQPQIEIENRQTANQLRANLKRYWQ